MLRPSAAPGLPGPGTSAGRAGQEGTTVSRLAPTGKIEIEGEFYEAQSLSTFIDPRKKIRVAKVEGAKIYVEQY